MSHGQAILEETIASRRRGVAAADTGPETHVPGPDTVLVATFAQTNLGAPTK